MLDLKGGTGRGSHHLGVCPVQEIHAGEEEHGAELGRFDEGEERIDVFLFLRLRGACQRYLTTSKSGLSAL